MGGAIKSSPYLLQLVADVLQHPVTVLAEEQATSRGTAALALRALDIWPTLEAVLPELGATYQPNRQRASTYLTGIERQHRLYDTFIGHDKEIGQRLAG